MISAISLKLAVEHWFLIIKSKPAEFWARCLVIGIVVTMTRAFALTNLFEFFLLLLFTMSPALRGRFRHVISDPRVFLVLIFWAWIAVATLWGQAPIEERFDEWWSWRKLLLVPFCFALFSADAHKVFLARSLILTCFVYMVFSWAGHLNLVELDRSPANLLENHATQGILFSVAAFFCYLEFVAIKDVRYRFLLVVLIVGFVSNILLVLTGRSGYVFLLILVAYSGFISSKSNRVLISACLGGLVLASLLISNTTGERISQAFSEAKAAYTSAEYTSLGVRIVMWDNALTMIEAKPLFGSGSGSFRFDYSDIAKHGVGWRSIATDDPHQQYLHIAAEQGLLGLLLFIFAISSWLFSTVDKGQRYAIAAFGILLGTVANGFANGHFSSFVEGRLVWIFVAAFLAGSSFDLPFRVASVKKNT